MASCTDLNEQLYDKVSQDDYGKTSSEVATIVGGAYATLEAMVQVLLRAQVSSVILLVSMSSSHRSAQVMKHVSQPVVTDWYDGGRYQQFNATTGTLRTLVSLSVWRYNFTGVSR